MEIITTRLFHQNIRNVQFLSILSRFITYFRKKELSMEKKYFSRSSIDKDGIHSIGRVYSRNVIFFTYIYISVSRIVFSTRKKGKAYVFLRIFFVASVDHRVCFRHETMIDTCTWTSNVRTR